MPSPAAAFTIEHMSALRAALIGVAAHAANEPTLPAISAVRFEASGGRLLLVATDRYTLGVYRVDVGATDGAHDDFEALVPAADVKLILSTFKTSRHDDPAATLSLDGGTLTVSTPDRTLTVRHLNAQFPPFRSLIKLADNIDQPAYRGYMPGNFARFEKSAGKHDHMVVHGSTGTKPTLVTIGDYFVGLIMPVRVGGDSTDITLPAWLAA